MSCSTVGCGSDDANGNGNGFVSLGQLKASAIAARPVVRINGGAPPPGGSDNRLMVGLDVGLRKQVADLHRRYVEYSARMPG